MDKVRHYPQHVKHFLKSQNSQVSHSVAEQVKHLL